MEEGRQESRTLRLAVAAVVVVLVAALGWIELRSEPGAPDDIRVAKDADAPAILAAEQQIAAAPQFALLPLGDPTDHDGLIDEWAYLPKELDGRASFAAHDGSSIAGWRMLGVPAVPRTDYTRGAAYALPGKVTVLQHVTGRQLREYIVVGARQGKRTWRWKLHTSDQRPPRLTPSGAVDFQNGMRIAPPVLLDADGKPLGREIRWRLDGPVLSLELDDTGLPLPYVIDPDMDATPPTARLSGFDELAGSNAYTWVDPTAPMAAIWYNPNPPVAGTYSFRVRGIAWDDDTGISAVNFANIPGAQWSGGGAGASAGQPAGLFASYFDAAAAPYGAPNFTGTEYNRQETTPTINWGAGNPVAQITDGTFSSRFTGYLTFPAGAGTWAVRYSGDDGIRMRVWAWDSGPNWVAMNTSAAIFTSGQTYRVVLEHYDVAGNASSTFQWDPPGATGWTTIPSTAFASDAEYTMTYSWDAGAPESLSNDIVAVNGDDPGFEDSSAPANFVVREDGDAPTGGSLSFSGGWQLNGNKTINFSNGTDALTGVANRYLQRQAAPWNGASCDPWPGAWTTLATNPAGASYPDSGLADGMCYRWRYLEVDNVGNEQPYMDAESDVVMVDLNDPTIAFVAWHDAANPQWSHASGTTMYVNANALRSGSFDLEVSAADSVAIDRVEFPTSGAGWSITPGAADTTAPYRVAYDWLPAATSLGTVQVTAYDDAGRTETLDVTFVVDNATPLPGSIDYTDGLTNDPLPQVTISQGVDALSGVDQWVIERQESPLLGGICTGPWSGFAPESGVSPGDPWTDNGTATGFCYEYRQVVTDNVDNDRIDTSPNTMMVDRTPPLPPSTADDGTALGSDVDFQASLDTIEAVWPNDASDAHSSVVAYEYCIAGGAAPPPPPASCSGNIVGWTDNAMGTSISHGGLALQDSDYYFVYIRSVDAAGNVSAETVTDGVRVDALPPNGPTWIVDGPGPSPADVTHTASPDTLEVSWNAATDAWGLLEYRVCLSTQAPPNPLCLMPVAGTAGWITVPPGNLDLTQGGLGLVDGQVYHVGVHAVDLGGAAGATIWTSDPPTSNPIYADYSGPAAVVGVDDGPTLGSDIAWQTSTTTIEAAFDDTGMADLPAGPAGSGVDRYEYCISDVAAGACDGSVRGWTDNALATTVTANGLALVHNTTYFVYVRAVDAVDNPGAQVRSDGVTVDAVAPSPPSLAQDGPAPGDVDVFYDDDELIGNWATDSVDADSGLARYEYCFSTSAAAADCAGGAVIPWASAGMAGTVTESGIFPLLDGMQPYYLHVRAIDVAGNPSAIASSDGQQLDVLDPDAPAWIIDGIGAVPADDEDFTAIDDTLEATWPASLAIDIDRYEYCFSTDPAGADCAGGATVPWTSNGLATSVSHGGIAPPLVDGQTYHAHVKAIDFGALESTVTSSDGILVDLTPPAAPPASREGPPPGDLVWQNDPVNVDGNWDAATDPDPGLDGPSDIAGYEYCISSSTPDPVCAFDVTGGGWQSAGAATDMSHGGLGLAHLDAVYVHARAVDNAGNAGAASASASPLTIDLVAPTVAITDPVPLQTISGNYPIDVTANDADSDIASILVEYLPGAVTICNLTPGGSGPATCMWDTTLVAEGPYTIRVTAFDNAGNASMPETVDVTLDNNAPDANFDRWEETVPSPWIHPDPMDPTRLYYNGNAGIPAPGTYGADAVVVATDGGTGMDRVDYPDLSGDGWAAPGGLSDAVPEGGGLDTWRVSYEATWPAGPADPAEPLTATAFDVGGNPDPTTFSVDPDSAGPLGGTVDYPAGANSTGDITVTYAAGADAESGVSHVEIQRSTTNVVGAACDAMGWSLFATVAVDPGSPWTDVGRPDLTCNRYQILVYDNVGNVSTFQHANPHPGDVVLIDMTPPVASITLAEGANPQYQYLDTPTRIYVNTDFAGDFTATVIAAHGSGIADVDFPPIGGGAAGWGGDLLDNAAPYATTYTWGASAGNPGGINTSTVTANTGSQTLLDFEVIRDTTPPNGVTLSYDDTYQQATQTDITFGTGADVTGISGWILERREAALVDGICAPYGGWGQVGPNDPASPYTDMGLSDQMCYKYRIQVTDGVGNVRTLGNATVFHVAVDQSAPASASFSIAEGANPEFQHVVGNTIWFNGTQSGDFTVSGDVVDPETFADSVTYPGLGAGWNAGGVVTQGDWVPAAATPSAVNEGALPLTSLDYTYAWTPAAAGSNPGVQNVTILNPSGLGVAGTFEVLEDATPPAAGGSINHAIGVSAVDSVDVTATPMSVDAESGYDRWFIEFRETPYDALTSTCVVAGWTAWAQIGPDNPVGPFNHAGLTPSTCYEYRIVEEDNVGNRTPTAGPGSYIYYIDVVPPDPFNLVPPAPVALPPITVGPPAPACAGQPTFISGTPLMQWTASSDADAGMDRYDVVIDGGVIGSTPDPGLSFTPGAAQPSGLHAWRVVAYDTAGNSRAATPDPMNVRFDNAPPTVNLSAPANGLWTNDTTPTLSWAPADDNCVARAQIYIDGGFVDTVSGSVTNYTVAAPLVDGAHTWRIDIVDGAGNVTASANRTINIDTVLPVPPAAINPPDGGSVPAGGITFSWGGASDADSGVATYDLEVNGSWVATGVAATSWGPVALPEGAHNWRVRVYDVAGNSTDSVLFTFDAVDGTPPDPFNLLTPANGSTISTGATLSWEPANDVSGIAVYNVFVNGSMFASVAGSETDYVLTTGIGPVQCGNDFDPVVNSAGCIYGAAYAPPWTLGAHGGFNNGGTSIGIDNWDANRGTTSFEYDVDVPGAGANLTFQHHYDMHASYNSSGEMLAAWDGGTVEISTDGGATWESTCIVGASVVYGVSIDCDHEIMERVGGYTAVLAGGTASPLTHRNVFGGDSATMQISTMRLTDFAGQTVRVRFVQGNDACHVGLPAPQLAKCPAGVIGSDWHIDDVQLTDPALPAGPYSWYVQAVDIHGNMRQSNQTWGFNLS